MARRLTVLLMAALLLGACATQPNPPLSGAPFQQDVASATDQLLQQWRTERAMPQFLASLFRSTWVNGPFVNLLDASDTRVATYSQPESLAADAARQIVAQRLDASAPELKRMPADAAAVADADLLLSASLSASAVASAADSTVRQQLTLVLLDRHSLKVLARWQGLVRVPQSSTLHTRFSSDSPVILNQPAAITREHLFGRGLGESVAAVDAADALQLALLNDAREAHDADNYERALKQFQTAAAQPSALALRAYNGEYLTDRALGRDQAADEAFKHIVAEGFKVRSLAMKLLFTPGDTSFWSDPAISGVYPFWIQEISDRAQTVGACLEVVGHTSRSGTEAFNQTLSLERAQRVAELMQADQAGLATRLATLGKGWSENIVGSGTDDLRDAIDRRVEFKISTCP